MESDLAIGSRDFLRNVYAFLRGIDPARWRPPQDTQTREELTGLQDQLAALISGSHGDSPDDALLEALAPLSSLLNTPPLSTSDPSTVGNKHWDSFRTSCLPIYEALVTRLKKKRLHVPSLRPTNYARNIYHASSSLLALVLYQYLLYVDQVLPVITGIAITIWILEGIRRVYTPLNQFFISLLGKFAHIQEHSRITSGTWYITAMWIMAFTASPLAIALAIIVTGLADPAAAIIGRRYGRTPLVFSRTLEGTLAFIAVALLTTSIGLLVLYPEIPTTTRLMIALAAAMAGGLCELFSYRVDDNLSIPLGTAYGVMIASALLHL